MKQRKAQTKREVIVEVWERRQCPPVGARELRGVQRALRARFGAGANDSPASIARVLADAGAELSHPEVIEYDARWREAKLSEEAVKEPIGTRDLAKPLTLKRAAIALKRLEKLRKQFTRANNGTELRRLGDAALSEKARAQLLARDHALGEQARAEQIEIVEWFRVWLQTPDLFADWLELRSRAPDFQKRFVAQIKPNKSQ